MPARRAICATVTSSDPASPTVSMVAFTRPLGPTRTRVSFRSYVWKPELRKVGAGADLHRVEMEDEEVVESVQRGVRSRLYERGRYSPRREVGTHHFHTLLDAFCRGGGGRGAARV